MEAAKIILEQIFIFTDRAPCQKSLPVFLAGDFNSETGQEAYSETTSKVSPMADLQLMVPESQRYGDHNTFSGFDPETNSRKRIDFIFVNKDRINGTGADISEDDSTEKWWLVDGYAVLPNRFEDGLYNSDHQVVCGDISVI